MSLLSKRHRLLAATAFLAVTACGAIVGVNSDLTAPPDETPEPVEDSGSDAGATERPDVSIGDFDAKPLDPPPDANTGCDAQSIGPLFADLVKLNDNPDTEINWQAKDNALLEDNARASAVAVFGGKPNSVKLGWIDFAKNVTLPANAGEIIGIRVDIVGKASTAGAFHDDFVGLRIVGDPNTVSGNHAVEPPAVTAATWADGDDTTHTFGGPTTRWELGAKLTADLVRNPNFALVYAVAVNSAGGQQFYLNAAKMTVFYCVSEK